MRRTQILTASWLLCALLFFAALPATASAQDDLRGIVPYIMLVVDTSGSMERQASCTCETASCTECLPRCNLANDADGKPDPEKKNRWAVTLEALTGDINNFECDPIQRTAANGMTYDIDYVFPYYQPWLCGGSPRGTPCAFDALGTRLDQESNGILDLNVSGIRFGLMTFDGIAGYGRDQQIVEADFDDGRSEGIDGLWSYGGKKPYKYPFCENTYFMDTGSRSNNATEGALISLESCSGSGPLGSPGCESWCTACPGTQDTVNKDIQEALLASRPYGSTPIAAALDDLYYHFKDDLSDAFRQCRDRFAILITDGRPDDDYRQVGCDCFEDGNPSDCGGPPNDPTEMRCPYPLPEEVASDLVEGRGTDGAMLERLYVLGLAVSGDPEALEHLEKIADAGCTETPEDCEIGTTGSQAIFAENLDSLKAAVQVIVDGNNHPVSRTVPVFALSDDPAEPQYMFNSALQLPTQSNEPWRGVLERSRFVCGATDADPNGFVALDNGERDRFDDELNTQSTRRLITALPSSFTFVPAAPTPNPLEGVLVKESSSCGTSGCPMVTFDASTRMMNAMQISTVAEATTVVNWMYAANNTPRDNAALGAIYHSTPAISSAPRYDTADRDYNEWIRRDRIANRPQVLFVGTTDGVLHAFSTGKYSNPGLSGWRDLDAGEEIWGFIPPMLLNDLRTNMTTQQFLMDGAPVVKNVTIDRRLGANGFRTILTMGMREGGRAYIALDVTDPFNPTFLWQATSPVMGKTYGQPAIVQAKFKRSVNGTEIDGAIAILPGGVGQLAAGGPACDGGTTQSMRVTAGGSPFDTQVPQAPSSGGTTAPPPRSAQHRADVRCWSPAGRALYFLDVSDGHLLKELHLTNPGQLLSTSNQPIFPSPLVSAPAAFPDETGTPASRVFITDADGVVWRIDLRSTDPDPNRPLEGWTARPFHDVFWGLTPTSSELAYEPPLLSTDTQGRPVVIVATGDTGNFSKPTVENRIVSLTEIETTAPVGSPLHYQASMNWQLSVRDTSPQRDTFFTDGEATTVDGLARSELVTGSMGLFEGQLFAGTFIAVANASDVCDFGRGRLFVVDYSEPDFLDTNPSVAGIVTYGPKRINAADPDDPESIVNVLRTEDAGDNVKISGISLVQVPSCSTTTAYTDPWTGESWAGVGETPPPEIYMTAHADNPRNDNQSNVQQRGGSAISTLQMRVIPTVRHSRVTSWATSAD